MREHGILPLVAAFCLMLSGISRVDAQEDSADLVFLIDGSNNVGSNDFVAIRDFLVNLVERRLDIGRNEIQVAVVQFSDDVKIEFTLDEHTTKSQLLNALKNLQPSGGEESNLGAAIDYVVENLFTSAAGSRREQGVPQSLVIITAGPSTDDFREATNALKLNSIITFGIAVERADTAELQQIASDASFVFVARQFQSLGDLEIQLVPYIAGVYRRTIVLEAPTTITEVVEVNRRDIVFLIDGSTALGGPNFAAIREFIIKVANRLEIGPDLIQVALAQYSRDVKTEFNLNTYGVKKDLVAQIKKMKIVGGAPLNTGAALNFVQRNIFTASAGSRMADGVPQLLVLITGGQAKDDIAQPSLELKQAGILTFTIGAKSADPAELQEIAFDQSLVFQPSEFKTVPLQGLLPSLLTPLKTLSGTVIVEGPTEVINQRDIVFLLDGSVNVGNTNLPFVRDFIINLINNLDIRSEGTRIGLAQFSDTPKTEFYLNTFSSKSDLVSRLGQLRLKGGNVLNTGSALQFVIRNLFTSSAGSRLDERIPQLLVVLLAGSSSDSIQAASRELINSGVLTFCIGVRNADKSEMETIAFNPTLVYDVDDFSNLPGFSQQFLAPLSTYVRGEVTEVTVTETADDNAKKDIVFLVDGSDDVGAIFPSFRSFIQRVVESLDVGQDRTRIAVVQYSDSARPVFALNTYPDSQGMVSSIRSMTPIGGSPLNTGAALDYVTRNVFVSSAGSRAAQGVPQFLILLTAGRSRDDASRQAAMLRASGVVTYAIGASRADQAELQTISFSPDFVLYVPEVTQLQNAYQTISQRVNQISRKEIETMLNTLPAVKESKRDILFLVDASSNVAGKFPLVRDFVLGIVESLNIGADDTRVSVAQVGENVRVDFKFDSFPTKQEVVNAVKRMRLRPERNFNLGAGLEYAHSNLFTQESGSRILEGVPQYLVLLSAGRSEDNVEEPADKLKRTGVVTFAIKGSSSADSDQLERIVLGPQFVVSADSLAELSAIQPQLTYLLKTVTVERPTVTSDVRKDIVFLVDGSDGGRSAFPSLRSFIQTVVEKLDVGQDKIRVGVVQYSDSARTNFLLNAYPDRQGVLNAVRRLSPIGGSSLNTGASLNYVTTNVFTSEAGSRQDEGVPQFLILLTTGKSRDDVRGPATTIKSSGVVPFAIGVNRADVTELQTISLVPDLAYSFSDVTQLGNAFQTITTRVSQLNRGEIEILKQSIPSVSYTGAKRDVVFLIDGSRDAAREFDNVRELIGKIVERMDVSPENTRVGVVQYSNDARADFLLNAHSTKEEVQNAVSRLRPKGGSVVNTGSALEYVSRNIFTKPAGSRIEEQVPQFLIVTSSGPSADDVEEGSRRIKESALVPFLIGKNVDAEEAKKITLGQDFVFSVSSFRELPSLEQKLLTSVTTLNPEQITTIYERQQQPDQEFDGERRDVVFLVDGSTNTGPDGLVRIRDFIYNIVQNMQIGTNKVRVGVVQFSNDAFPEFKLNSFFNKQVMLSNIRRMRHRGGAPLNIGKALEYAVTNMFVKAGGSRIEEGVPQHLVLLTGGKSQDDVRGSARILGNANVKSLAVATSGADRTEIQNIVSDPRYLFTIRDFTELQRIQDVLLRSFEGPVDPTPPEPPQVSGRKEADIVFLVDGSINLGRDNFKEVLQFVSGIVDAVYDEGDSIQIGLAQFNSDVTDEFFLKDFTDRDTIMDSVTKAEYKGGRVASLGAAISHLQDKHFVKPAGSRIGTGVPQIAFIVTGAKSVDEGRAAALSLASKGVKVFAIGLGSITTEEVSKIASDSPSAFRVPNVQELSELNEQILITLDTALTSKPSALCPGLVDTSKECKLEVIIGFDVSEMLPGQNIFTVQRALEPKLKQILNLTSNMQSISCTGQQRPSVKVSILAQSRSGAVEAFDFSDYRTELDSKFLGMGTRGPFVLTSKTLQSYLNKFKTSADDDSIKVIIHMTDGPDEDMGLLQASSEALQSAGVRALLFVALENAARFDQVMHLEFGRGFTYTNPLRVNRVDLHYEIIEELDNIAEKGCCGVPCKCSGQRGDLGPPGLIGVKGASGLKGHRGFPGEEGGPGERGPPGVNGTQGFQGCPGVRGQKGTRGFSGEKGEIGEIGLDGIDGEDGKRGIPGPAGERGSLGPRGEKGLKGTKGDRGDVGLRGNPGDAGPDSTQRGSRGTKGDLGSVGEPGQDGEPGGPGGPGKLGPVGRRGPPGLKGNRGTAGVAGGLGEQGLRGPQGPQGEPGPPGTSGEQGSPGPRGPGGTPGSAGDRGRIGQLGRKGEPGEPGAGGSEGPAGPRGETGDDGRDGSGKPGLKGKKGETGFPGYPGPKGDAGDRGPNGELGPKGNRGSRGTAGLPGTGGTKGDPGYPGPSGLKGERGGSRDQCALVKNIKNKCPCCYGPKECPVFPTDLVFAVDTSSDVNRNQFNNMKQLMQRVIGQLSITDSNCPRGARIAMLTYNSDITTEIRFSDALRKPALLEKIRNMQITQTTKQRSLESAMSFVARNTFKRARGGFLIRKVAVFFSNGPTRASPQLNEAVLKLYDAGVSSVFLTNREDRPLTNALQVNNTVVGQALVLSTVAAQFNETIRKVLSCHVCLDVCEPESSCGAVPPRGDLRLRRSAITDVDVDLAFLIDSSESTTPTQFAEIKKFVAHVVGQFELSPDPKSSSHHGRVSVFQNAPYEHLINKSFPPVKVDVGLTEYTSKEQLQAFIQSKMTQLYGTRSLNNAFQYVVENVFESAPNPRAMKVIFLVLTGEVKAHELKQLRQTVTEAKCKGFFIVILSIGKKVDAGQLHTLASEPHDVFSKKADKPSELHEETLLRFGLQLPGFISSENAFHLSPEIQKQCDWFQNDQPVRMPVPQNESHNEPPLTAVIPDEMMSSQSPEVITVHASTNPPMDQTFSTKVTEILGSELLVSDVAENSVRLTWPTPDSQQPQLYDLSVTSLSDQALILQQNITGTETVIEGLKSGEQYLVTVTGHQENNGHVSSQATFTAGKNQPDSEAVASTDLLVTKDTLNTPQIDPCGLELDMGTQCKQIEVKWFFDKTNKICTQIWYGGCGGNANRFDTEAECLSRCQNISGEKFGQAPSLEAKPMAGTEICYLQKEEGTCRDFKLKWHYDPKTKSCTRFWYGGCGGNDNRFDTQKECENTCIPVPLNPGVVSAIGT
ncbi:collagen alpha-3(VI) chain [Pelodytes ibericus]